MQHRILLLATAAGLAGGLASQGTPVAGLDGKLYDISSPRVWGRVGSAYPNGEIGFSAANYMCNPGTVTIPWYQAGSSAAGMGTNHPKFGFMITRLAGDRMEQISDRSFCKHAFTSINGSQGPCLPCQNPGTGSVMGIGCYDVYSNGNNGDRFWLGPADEIDPWLGTWNHIGSYFDRGDPAVTGPAASDGVRSLTSAMTSAMNVVKNRVTVQEQDLVVAGAQFFYMIHLLHEGEAVDRRGDNIMSRGVSFSWNGTSWAVANVGNAVTGSVLNRWPGASLTMAGNGLDDGRIAVAVKVTGPNNGMWHYEYAVHNIDNSRGAASFRIPVCANATVNNLSFRDIDRNFLNNWTATVSGGEIVFTAPPENPLNWNLLFNFGFDSDAAPVAGDVTFDQARIGPGALSFTVPSTVPGFVPNVDLGPGCGAPAVTLTANGVPSIPNPTFALEIRSTPNTGVFAFFSLGTASIPLGPGCTQYLDNGTFGSHGFLLTTPAGTATIPLPLPASLMPMDMVWQAVSLQAGGALFGSFNLSNGLRVRVGATDGCQ